MTRSAHSKSKYTTVSVPTPLFEHVRRRVGKKGFPSVSSYVTFLLREAADGEDEQEGEKARAPKGGEAKVRERLRKLGYLD